MPEVGPVYVEFDKHRVAQPVARLVDIATARASTSTAHMHQSRSRVNTEPRFSPPVGGTNLCWVLHGPWRNSPRQTIGSLVRRLVPSSDDWLPRQTIGCGGIWMRPGELSCACRATDGSCGCSCLLLWVGRQSSTLAAPMAPDEADV